MQQLSLIQQLIILIPPILLAITLHEVAHGWMALRYGDTTAQAQGRLSLNPLRHIDPVGTVLVPIGLYTVSVLTGGMGFLFGWAKPVPVNFARLHNPRRDMALVALAGPGANLIMAIGWAVIMVIGRTLYMDLPWLGMPLYLMGRMGILVNLIIGVLNMLPVPPLDGSRVLAGLLPPRAGEVMARIEPYGLIILLVMLVTGVLQAILWPPIALLSRVFYTIFGY